MAVDIAQLLAFAVKNNASDLHLSSGVPPMIRVAGAVFRNIPSAILSLDELNSPKIFRDLCMLPRGLVLVTGPTGSGKSTTLAGMVNHCNDNRPDHIIT